MKISWVEINIGPYIEKDLISKRFIIAIAVLAYFAYTGNGEGIVGTVAGFYFGTHTSVTK